MFCGLRMPLSAFFVANEMTSPKGLIPIFFMIIVAAALMMGIALDRGIDHVESKAERHQRQVEAE